MANTLATPTWTLKEVGRRYVNIVTFIRNVRRTYSDEYVQAGAKVGDTVKARLPQKFQVTSGEAFQPQDLYARTVPISLTDQLNVGCKYSSAQATLEVTGSLHLQFHQLVIDYVLQVISILRVECRQVQ